MVSTCRRACRPRGEEEEEGRKEEEEMEDWDEKEDFKKRCKTLKITIKLIIIRERRRGMGVMNEEGRGRIGRRGGGYEDKD